MKTIGMIGGMSWESTVTYYQVANEVVRRELGGLHSAKILLYSVDFADIERCQARGDWETCASILTEAAQDLERAGADYLIICTNTMHKVAPQMEKTIGIPIVHIAEATAEALRRNGVRRAALLGTKYTMTQDFYKDKLVEAGIEVLIPDEADRELIHRVIYQELCQGIISQESKKAYQAIVEKLGEKGAQGVILGCTEIGLLLQGEDVSLPVFDTAQIHAEKAALLSMEPYDYPASAPTGAGAARKEEV